ncbi:MAG: hypothetical protein CEN91_591 [Candidatus Berkelbacteria bacterium Licking1014_85]|uniref:Uncharacterized protein n=1 Tax=Candidatus Berkelbacteria bacterium Licking1014_85 TaxID=2017148 RepID=A0A554LG64_9BACT|nr:MAG: hypothetical protein CEN91_591 [Candidatus Berkelbacteria bacterium Licking1014_85]
MKQNDEITIGELAKIIAKSFESVEQRYGDVDRKFDKIDARFDKIDERFEKIDERFDWAESNINSKFKELQYEMGMRFNKLENDVRDLNERFE